MGCKGVFVTRTCFRDALYAKPRYLVKLTDLQTSRGPGDIVSIECRKAAISMSKNHCISGRLEHEYLAEKTTNGMKFARTHRSSKEVLRHHTKVTN